MVIMPATYPWVPTVFYLFLKVLSSLPSENTMEENIKGSSLLFFPSVFNNYIVMKWKQHKQGDKQTNTQVQKQQDQVAKWGHVYALTCACSPVPTHLHDTSCQFNFLKGINKVSIIIVIIIIIMTTTKTKKQK